MVEKLLLLKISPIINFRGFHCLQKIFNSKLFPDYGIYIYTVYKRSVRFGIWEKGLCDIMFNNYICIVAL